MRVGGLFKSGVGGIFVNKLIVERLPANCFCIILNNR